MAPYTVFMHPNAILGAARITLPADSTAEITGVDPILPSRFRVGEAAAAALAACGVAASDLWMLRGGQRQSVTVDVRAAAASLLSFAFQRVDGKPTPRAAAGLGTVALYECGDGRWIHLHGAFPWHRAGTLDVLGCVDDAMEIAAAVRRWDGQSLEDALAARGLCGAMVRTVDEWRAHPQGDALAPLPAIEVIRIGDADPQPLPAAERPLSGIRALDLTRVLAGPACGRALAEHGAEVLLVSSPKLPSALPFVMDTSHGKRSAYLDLNTAPDAETLQNLIGDADVFAQGYRSGAMERRGFGPEDVARRRPGIIYVSINCYGHIGPWRERPGWEQLAQTVTGIAAQEGSIDRPKLIPAAACDYTTGYLAAYGVMVALARRATEGGSWHVRASLCQTAMWFDRLGATCDPAAATGIGDPADLMTQTATPFGQLAHLEPALKMSATPPRWDLPTVPLGTHAPKWVSSL
jgi:crotonobetainyl-CoA:carnitine CoA-transferase CaiB-like acyl-CoA transferase